MLSLPQSTCLKAMANLPRARIFRVDQPTPGRSRAREVPHWEALVRAAAWIRPKPCEPSAGSIHRDPTRRTTEQALIGRRVNWPSAPFARLATLTMGAFTGSNTPAAKGDASLVPVVRPAPWGRRKPEIPVGFFGISSATRHRANGRWWQPGRATSSHPSPRAPGGCKGSRRSVDELSWATQACSVGSGTWGLERSRHVSVLKQARSHPARAFRKWSVDQNGHTALARRATRAYTRSPDAAGSRCRVAFQSQSRSSPTSVYHRHSSPRCKVNHVMQVERVFRHSPRRHLRRTPREW
jgi:hypothetical protein